MTAREAYFAGRDLSSRVLKVVRRIVGVPDYEAYLRHQYLHHPDIEPMSRKVFLERCWEEKYSRPGNRCC
jgi:uncharacterized short protein YbdD (DUF466 family)